MDAIPEQLDATRTNARTPCELSLDDLEVWVHLGCTAGERATTQPILVSISLRFPATPAACRTDSLADTVCYAEMAATARDVCSSHDFHTVESMAWEIGHALRLGLDDTTLLTVRLTKPNAPVPGLRGGVTFTIDA